MSFCNSDGSRTRDWKLDNNPSQTTCSGDSTQIILRYTHHHSDYHPVTSTFSLSAQTLPWPYVM